MTVLGRRRWQSQQSRVELGCVSAVTSEGRIMRVADAHRDDEERKSSQYISRVG